MPLSGRSFPLKPAGVGGSGGKGLNPEVDKGGGPSGWFLERKGVLLVLVGKGTELKLLDLELPKLAEAKSWEAASFSNESCSMLDIFCDKNRPYSFLLL